MARALILWGYQVSILIVLNVFEVWANSDRKSERDKEDTEKNWVVQRQDKGEWNT